MEVVTQGQGIVDHLHAVLLEPVSQLDVLSRRVGPFAKQAVIEHELSLKRQIAHQKIGHVMLGHLVGENLLHQLAKRLLKHRVG